MNLESIPLLQVSTGDVMGDIHAAELVKSMYAVASETGIDLQIVALGGKHVEAAGAELIGKTRCYKWTAAVYNRSQIAHIISRSSLHVFARQETGHLSKWSALTLG